MTDPEQAPFREPEALGAAPPEAADDPGRHDGHEPHGGSGPHGGPGPLGDPGPQDGPLSGRNAWRLNLLLFLATVGTTWLVMGAAYSAALMAILVTHEMGHWVMARRYGVAASLPYFIPIPFAFGTFGAVIKMDDRIPDRRALVAIGAAGPLAGLAVALPLLWLGLSLSKVAPVAGPAPGLTDMGLLGLLQESDGLLRIPLAFVEGDSILYRLAKWAVLDLPEGTDVWIHPVAFAAWIGLFITALNLVPVGQLDGGHVAYGLFGDRAHRLNDVVRGILLGLGLTIWSGWLAWVVIITVILRMSGGRHPPVQDETIPLPRSMRVVGLVSLAVFALTFSPVPMRDVQLTRAEAKALPPALMSELGLCEARIDWHFDVAKKGLSVLSCEGVPPPPPCVQVTDGAPPLR